MKLHNLISVYIKDVFFFNLAMFIVNYFGTQPTI